MCKEEIISLNKFADIIHFFPNSVHILATDGKAGKRAIAVSSVVPFSYNPPSMLVCIQKQRECNIRFIKNKVFTINILADHHEEIVSLFGGKTGDEHHKRFEYLAKKTLKTKAPIIKNAILVFDCILDVFYEHLTHYILIGKIVDTYVTEDIEKQKILICRKKQYLSI